MGFCKPIGQLFVDKTSSTRHCCGTDSLDHTHAREEDCSLSQHLDKPARKHDAPVRLHRCLRQFLDGKPVMTCREQLKAEDCLEFRKMLSPGLWTVSIVGPTLNGNLELIGDKMQKRCEGELVRAEHHARKAEVAELHREAEAIGSATMLSDDRSVGFAQGIAPDQVVLVIGQGEKLSRSAAERIERRGM